MIFHALYRKKSHSFLNPKGAIKRGKSQKTFGFSERQYFRRSQRHNKDMLFSLSTIGETIYYFTISNNMGKVSPTLEQFTEIINKYISLIPMCFVSWFVWLMIDDPFMATMLFILGCWFVWPLTVWAIIVFLQSLWKKGFLWKVYQIWGCALILLVGAFFISPTRLGNRCDPDIMAEHYDKYNSELRDLIDYTNQSLDKGAEMRLEFEHGDISIFHVRKNDSAWSCNWDVHSKEKTDSLMQVVGLSHEELKNIRRKLKKLDCISIETPNTHSDYAEIGFRRVDMGKYSYRIYNRPLNDEEKKKYLDDPMFIPYTDRVVFEYGGGAIGSQSFGEEIKEEFMKKHPMK